MRTNHRLIVRQILQEAYRVAQEYGGAKGGRKVSRGASGDISTELDLIVERAIIASIMERIPDCLIVTEESGVIGRKDSRFLVIVDPVDGSTNASRGIPFYSSTLAIVEGRRFNDITAAGVIDLVTGELIDGEKYGGVELNGRPLPRLQKEKTIHEACVAINGRIADPKYRDAVANLLTNLRYPRFLGSAALETAYVALGRLDGYVEALPRLRTFDCVPSLFLVKEAGGLVKTLNLDLAKADLSEHLRLSYIAARSPKITEWLLSIVSKRGS
ncbi:MAG: inositol monophosphatase [Thaumarchaeota archaeon]|nr:inositol monophosphatase [Nitrososphaerota archaeon]